MRLIEILDEKIKKGNFISIKNQFANFVTISDYIGQKKFNNKTTTDGILCIY